MQFRCRHVLRVRWQLAAVHLGHTLGLLPERGAFRTVKSDACRHRGTNTEVSTTPMANKIGESGAQLHRQAILEWRGSEFRVTACLSAFTSARKNWEVQQPLCPSTTNFRSLFRERYRSSKLTVHAFIAKQHGILSPACSIHRREETLHGI